MSDLPAGVLDFARRGPAWAAFVGRLPRLVRDLVEEWELVPDGPATHGHAAYVLPVRWQDAPAMLKVGFPDDESEHEALALQSWGGVGAVRLLRADPHRRALLLERLRTTDLTGEWDLAACEIIGALYGRLHVPAPPRLRRLSTSLARWNADLALLPRDAPLPRRMVEQAVRLGRDLLTDATSEGASDGRLLHTDLHYENVLASERAGAGADWLAIDPKPLSGDPHYEVAPLLWNRWEEVTASGNVREAVRRRFHSVVDAAGLEEDRARDWVVVRMLHNALWELRDSPGAPDSAWLTTCVAVAKAVQD